MWEPNDARLEYKETAAILDICQPHIRDSIDTILISVLIKRWRPETNIFFMR